MKKYENVIFKGTADLFQKDFYFNDTLFPEHHSLNNYLSMHALRDEKGLTPPPHPTKSTVIHWEQKRKKTLLTFICHLCRALSNHLSSSPPTGSDGFKNKPHMPFSKALFCSLSQVSLYVKACSKSTVLLFGPWQWDIVASYHNEKQKEKKKKAL